MGTNFHLERTLSHFDIIFTKSNYSCFKDESGFGLPRAVAFKNVRKRCSNTITRLIKGVTDTVDPFVFWVGRRPCLMPSQSHCSHTVTLHLSACPPALGSAVSSQALSCCCGVPPTGPAAAVDHSNTDCSIICSLEHPEKWDEDTTYGF